MTRTPSSRAVAVRDARSCPVVRATPVVATRTARVTGMPWTPVRYRPPVGKATQGGDPDDERYEPTLEPVRHPLRDRR